MLLTLRLEGKVLAERACFKPGTRMLLDDGALSLTVESTTDTDVVCRVVDGGMLADR
ncbi:MAG TPA: hypothetical protein VF075_12380 [Pyrinomonadaceae bacterium]